MSFGNYIETPAANERFGASGGVTPPKVLCENESEYPAGTLVRPPPSPSRLTLEASSVPCSEIIIEKNIRQKTNYIYTSTN
jgi:hypothetical protein